MAVQRPASTDAGRDGGLPKWLQGYAGGSTYSWLLALFHACHHHPLANVPLAYARNGNREHIQIRWGKWGLRIAAQRPPGDSVPAALQVHAAAAASGSTSAHRLRASTACTSTDQLAAGTTNGCHYSQPQQALLSAAPACPHNHHHPRDPWRLHAGGQCRAPLPLLPAFCRPAGAAADGGAAGEALLTARLPLAAP